MIILLTFTDFKLSGQNIETEVISFCKIQIIEFYDTHRNIYNYILCMYIFIWERTTNHFDLLWLFKHNIYYTQYERGMAHHTIFSHAPQMTSQLTIISSGHTFFIWAMLLFFQMYYLMLFSVCFLNLGKVILFNMV